MDVAPRIDEGEGGCTIEVHAVPGAREPSAAWDPWTGALRVRVAERAEKGRANDALEEYLSRLFGVKATILSGRASRRKRVRLPGIPRGRVLAAVGAPA